MTGRRREGDRSRCGELERVGLKCFLSSEGAQRLKKKHEGQGEEIQGGYPPRSDNPVIPTWNGKNLSGWVCLVGW